MKQSLQYLIFPEGIVYNKKRTTFCKIVLLLIMSGWQDGNLTRNPIYFNQLYLSF